MIAFLCSKKEDPGLLLGLRQRERLRAANYGASTVLHLNHPLQQEDEFHIKFPIKNATMDA